MGRTLVLRALFIAALPVIVPTTAHACTWYYVDTGYVRDADQCSVQENVIAYSTLRHNHWESGGSFTISGTAETSNAWQVGAKSGYEASASVKAGVLAEVTASAKVSVDVGEELSGNEMHSWTVSDTVEKQHCKCPVWKSWVTKPTEAGSRKVEEWVDPCGGGDDWLRDTDWAVGTATGDHNEQSGVTTHYNFKQDTVPCHDCYGPGGDCPGTP